MLSSSPRLPRTLLAVPAALALAACGDAAPPSTPPDMAQPRVYRNLNASLTWSGNNRQRLDDLLLTYGARSAGYNAAKKPVAIFDWDNTTIKNDVGDAVTFWMLKNDKIRQPPSKNWRLTSPYLTTDAAAALTAACGALSDAGQPLPTSRNAACADEILSIYNTGLTSQAQGAKAAFAGWDYRRIEPAYAWTVQLQAGYTPAEIGQFASAAIAENLQNPIGATQTIGTTTGLNAYVRVYDQIKDLIGALQDNGFDVWVSTASSQYIVEVFAQQVNIAADHVMGVRLVMDASGKVTSNLQGCGDVPDGTNDGAGKFTGNSLITYIDGKRCWANKMIWGVSGAAALEQTADPTRRQVFAAGDSNTDVTFVRDATVLKLIINRNKKELMCNGYNNYGSKYLVNPMFIDPKARQAAAYPCTTTACVDKAGAAVPCMDEGAPPKAIPDQMDTVYPM